VRVRVRIVPAALGMIKGGAPAGPAGECSNQYR
jgi:hypothetical protein